MFYTSYASSAGDRGPVQRFHIDVQAEVYSALGRGPAAEGLLKHAEPAPEPDPGVLDCRAMLALYSPDYLDDTQCAREWSVFRERMYRRMRRTGEQPDALVAVVWRADSLVLPRVVATTGEIIEDSGSDYPGPDVLQLQQDPNTRDRYRSLVRRVAERLVRAARTPLPSLSRRDGLAVAPRFGPDRSTRRERPRPPSPPSHPPATIDRSETQRIVVVLVTATRNRMQTLRESVTAYGDTAQEWRPFRPNSDETAASVVTRVLHLCGVERTNVVTVDGDRPVPRTVTDDPADVLLVVDPWMASDPSFPVLWERLAHSRGHIAAVVTVIARHDPESMRNADRLREELSRTPARALGAAHHEVGTSQSLAHTIAGVLADTVPQPPEEAEREPESVWSGELRLESPADRLVRRQRERAGWLQGGAGTWLLSGTPGEA